MPKYPYIDDITPLLDSMEVLPIDESVPYSDKFAQLLEEHGDNLWGPQTGDPSKLATRLHFAGWTRAELEEVGLKPKDVENFRRKHKLTSGRTGRPSMSKGPKQSLRFSFDGSDEPVSKEYIDTLFDGFSPEIRREAHEAATHAALQAIKAVLDQEVARLNAAINYFETKKAALQSEKAALQSELEDLRQQRKEEGVDPDEIT